MTRMGILEQQGKNNIFSLYLLVPDKMAPYYFIFPALVFHSIFIYFLY